MNKKGDGYKRVDLSEYTKKYVELQKKLLPLEIEKTLLLSKLNEKMSDLMHLINIGDHVRIIDYENKLIEGVIVSDLKSNFSGNILVSGEIGYYPIVTDGQFNILIEDITVSGIYV
ncbi:MAG: hypothetical protein ACYDAO_04460 [Thermoplasmataceae archaeon]